MFSAFSLYLKFMYCVFYCEIYVFAIISMLTLLSHVKKMWRMERDCMRAIVWRFQKLSGKYFLDIHRKHILEHAKIWLLACSHSLIFYAVLKLVVFVKFKLKKKGTEYIYIFSVVFIKYFFVSYYNFNVTEIFINIY